MLKNLKAMNFPQLFQAKVYLLLQLISLEPTHLIIPTQIRIFKKEAPTLERTSSDIRNWKKPLTTLTLLKKLEKGASAKFTKVGYNFCCIVSHTNATLPTFLIF